MQALQIAIDGPASSGKSTVAKLLAKKHGYTYLDTGAMYRAATYLALQEGLDLEDAAGIVAALDAAPISFGRNTGGEQWVYVGDVEITDAIRQPDVTQAVSTVAALPEVREKLVQQQQALAQAGEIVMDGRDIGTTVLPNAQVKIFLVASVEERAERRYKENLTRGIETDLEVLKAEIAERDYKDSHREVSPLKPAADAIHFDTTGVSIDGVVAFIESKIEKIKK
ncbi:(d)CMP kinase [Streptococcus sp. NLN76]|uniref:(d)CMP kinase n=1 Tax=Streptococcus sp. NLN76 TaxID=2822800 RepID=UPI0018AB1EC5|nr:(d)CMP kinase [Streptococcus sp. NLN76]MBF8970887.1 (d)CMP kinase [Streptococcus sp. NLN76]